MNTFLSVLQVIVCVLIVVAVMAQESPKGASGALTGSEEMDTHYDKIKGRTSDAVLKKVTAFLGVMLVVLTFAINIL